MGEPTVELGVAIPTVETVREGLRNLEPFIPQPLATLHQMSETRQGEKGEYIASVSPDDGNCPALINARLIAACPKMYDFVELRAKEGDENAQKILRDMRP